ncbi:MAG: PAS domain S-box protein [Methylophilaceae bacterium]
MEKKNLNNLSNSISNHKSIDDEIDCFNSLFEHMADGVLIVNAKKITQYANPSLCDMLGHSIHEVKSKCLSDILSPQNKSSLITKQQVSQCQCLLKCKNGRTQLVDTTIIKKPNDQLLIVVKDYALRLAEETAQNEKLLSDMMFQSMPGVFYLFNDEGDFLRWNNNFRTVSGYTSNEIAKMHPTNFFPDEEKAIISEKITEAFSKGEAFVEASLLTKYGQKIPYYFTGRRLVFDGHPCVAGMGIDTTQRKIAETKLDQIQQNYRELVESANSIILRWDYNGVITFLNTYGQRFFGYKAEEIVGQHVIGTIVPYSDSAGRNLSDLMEQICLDTKAFEQNVNENMIKNGQRVWISWTNKIVLDAKGDLVEILSIGNDITQRLQAEKEIKLLNANLEKRVAQRTNELKSALIRAESADKIKSAFLATMSHELRTPLNSIIGFTGIVLQKMAGPLNTEQTKQLSMVQASARHLLALINDVLDISKIEAGQLKIQLARTNINHLIEEVITSLKPTAEKKGLVLSSSIAENLNEIVTDSRRLKQVLINLANNAIKFTDKGTVEISANLVVDEKELNKKPYVKFYVNDTGIGMKPNDIDQLFQPFHQIDSGLSRLHDGTGLGLVICKKLVNLMKGTISVQSEWGKGSEFTVTLPIELVLE